MGKRKTPKPWTAYRLARVGKRLGIVYGETEKEALANAHKEFARTEAEKKRIYANEVWSQPRMDRAVDGHLQQAAERV